MFVIAAGYAGGAVISAQRPELAEADRAAIQQLSDRLVQLLNTCAADDYAAMFAPDGYFESTFRGRVQGREKLVELVRSERHCAPGAAPRTAGATLPLRILPTAGGAVGTAALAGNAGGIEEHYVKTAQGWRFASRTVFTAQELAARSAPASSANAPGTSANAPGNSVK